MKVHHSQTEAWMIDVVRRKLSEFDYHGKLDSQHYSFCKIGVVAPFPVFHHLLFCYNRTAGRLQLKLGCSLLFRWLLRRNPGRITHVSQMLSCDLSGQSRFLKSREVFEKQIDALSAEFLGEHTRMLTEDKVLREGMHLLLTVGELPERFTPKDASDLHLVLRQRNLESEEPAVIDPGSRQFDAFLADLVPEQAEVSTGTFTLATSEAAAKLQRYQLSSPQNFVVHLVGGAVAGGATHVRVHVDSDDIVVEFDGPSLGEDELAELMGSMFNPHASDRCKELGVALNAAMSLRPLSLTLESRKEQRGFVLRVTSGGVVSELEPTPPEPTLSLGHRIAFRDKPSLRVARRFLNSLERSHPEIDLLRQRCGLSPIPILVDDQDLRRLPPEESVLFLQWEHPLHCLGDWDTPTVPGLAEDSPGEFSALFLIGPQPTLEVRVNGILYQAPNSEQVWPCWCLIVKNDLNRDLSYTGISDNAVWGRLIAEIPKATAKLRKLALEHLPGSEGSKKAALARFLLNAGHQGFKEAFQYPVFPTIEGKFSTLQLLLRAREIFYTQQTWKYPLRSGDEVFYLEPRDQTLLKLRAQEAGNEINLVSKDQEVASSQVYFAKREQWMAKPPVELKLDSAFKVVRNLRNHQGQIGLSKGASSLRLHALGRPLPELESLSLGPGVCIILNHNDLQVDDQWTCVLDGPLLKSLLNSIPKEIESFYLSLLSSKGTHTAAILKYLLYRKQAGREWESWLNRLEFRVLGGGTSSWEELNEGHGLGSLKTDWVRTFHVPLNEKRLLARLLA
jgi:hypothetical protein